MAGSRITPRITRPGDVQDSWDGDASYTGIEGSPGGDPDMSDERRDRGRDTVLYRLVVSGRPGESWLEWFGADAVEPGEVETVLWVRVMDQAELFGRLRRIHDLNLTLLGLALVRPGAQEASAEASHPPEYEKRREIP
jgi:hypothetical protein